MKSYEEAVAEISAHREKIDALDEKIAALMNERAGHSLAIRALKPAANMQLFDPARENLIFEKLKAINEGPMSDGNLREIYATLLKVMKEIEV